MEALSFAVAAQMALPLFLQHSMKMSWASRLPTPKWEIPRGLVMDPGEGRM